jgi:hypothetical protein
LEADYGLTTSYDKGNEMFLDAPISANPQTSDLIQNQIIPGLKVIAAFVAQWAVPLAAIGSVSMALIQAIKNETPIRNWFQQFKLRQWLLASLLEDFTDGRFRRFSNRLKRRFGGNQEIRRVQEQHLRNIEQELILLATSGDRDAFYDLQIEDMCDQIRKVVSVILDYPKLHEDLLVCMARGASQEDIDRILGRGRFATLGSLTQSSETEKETLRNYVAAKNRILLQIRCSVDAIQTSIGFRWKFWLQSASMVLSAVLGAVSIYLGALGAISSAAGKMSTFESSILVGFLAGFLAPIARDLVATIEQWASR